MRNAICITLHHSREHVSRCTWHRAGIKHPVILEYVTKKLVRNFEGQNESIFRKLRGLNAEVVSYKKMSVFLCH